MGKPKAPKPPDPKETAAAQTGTNVATAAANAATGNVNQVTPYGNLTYDQTGTYAFTDPTTGQTYNLPQYTATQTLSEAGQQMLDANNQAGINMANLGSQLSGQLQDHFGQSGISTEGLPEIGGDTSADRQRIEAALRHRMEPQLNRNRESIMSRLAGQGIKEGSTAFDRAMNRHDEQRNDANMQAIIHGGNEMTRQGSEARANRAQLMNERYAARGQPINEITALMSGSQVRDPRFVPAQGATIPTTDYAGLVNQNYNQQMGRYQTQNANWMNTMGGLFNLGSAAIMAG